MCLTIYKTTTGQTNKYEELRIPLGTLITYTKSQYTINTTHTLRQEHQVHRYHVFLAVIL